MKRKTKLKPLINWNDLFKIRVRELSDAQTKHLIVKSLIVQQILIKHRKDKNFLRVYTEFPIKEGKVCDVYYENIKKKEAYAYEIQSRVSKEWLDETNKSYKDWEVLFMNSSWVLIKLDDLSDDIETLTKQIKELIL